MSGITTSSGSSSGENSFTISSRKRKIPPAEEEDDESGNEKEIHVEDDSNLERLIPFSYTKAMTDSQRFVYLVRRISINFLSPADNNEIEDLGCFMRLTNANRFAMEMIRNHCAENSVASKSRTDVENIEEPLPGFPLKRWRCKTTSTLVEIIVAEIFINDNNSDFPEILEMSRL